MQLETFQSKHFPIILVKRILQKSKRFKNPRIFFTSFHILCLIPLILKRLFHKIYTIKIYFFSSILSQCRMSVLCYYLCAMHNMTSKAQCTHKPALNKSFVKAILCFIFLYVSQQYRPGTSEVLQSSVRAKYCSKTFLLDNTTVHIYGLGPSINYVVSKSAIFDPLFPSQWSLFTK